MTTNQITHNHHNNVRPLAAAAMLLILVVLCWAPLPPTQIQLPSLRLPTHHPVQVDTTTLPPIRREAPEGTQVPQQRMDSHTSTAFNRRRRQRQRWQRQHAASLVVPFNHTASTSRIATTTTTSSLSSSTHQHRQLEARIVGGDAVSEDVPYFAQLEMGCGGTLFHDDLILTAAHCDTGDWTNRRVWIGSKGNRNGLLRTVVHRVVHPKYYPLGAVLNDFLILKLSQSALVELDEDWTRKDDDTGTVLPRPTVQLVTLNRDVKNPMPEQTLTTMGYGKTDPWDGAVSNHLRDVDITTVENKKCAELYSAIDRTIDGRVHICAGDLKHGGKDSCQGDSGGSLIDPVTGEQVGVTSWGYGCGLKEYPGVYARVSSAMKWIDDVVCRTSCFPPQEQCAALGITSEDYHPCALPDGTKLPNTFSLSVQVVHDRKPQETAWALDLWETSQQLAYQPFGHYFATADDDKDERAYVVEPRVDNLQAGTYHFMMSDYAYNGMLEPYEDQDPLPGVTISLLQNGEEQQVLYQHDGDFFSHWNVYLTLDATGNLVSTSGAAPGESGVSSNHVQAYWAALSSNSEALYELYDPEEKDPHWPGSFPAGSEFAIAVNTLYDDYAKETNWTLQRLVFLYDDLDEISDGTWETRITQQGNDPGAGITITDILNPGVYKIEVTDEKNDGICCEFGRGWMTLTTSSPPETVVWRTDGDFGSRVFGFIFVHPEGSISEIEQKEVYDKYIIAEEWTNRPTSPPSGVPTRGPTSGPSSAPSQSKLPTPSPSEALSSSPTKTPSSPPSQSPSPSLSSTTSQSKSPTKNPTSSSPSFIPSRRPTDAPTTVSSTTVSPTLPFADDWSNTFVASAIAGPTETSSPASAPVVTMSPTTAAVVTVSPTTALVVTSSPTTAPAVTSSPTTAPVLTSSPTTAPSVTSSPTTAPSVTSSPTTAPVLTSSPTTAPVVTSSPTTAPVVTSSPTTAPVLISSPTTAPGLTNSPTMVPVRTSSPTTAPVLTSSPTIRALAMTNPPTKVPVVTNPPTKSPVATNPPTKAPVVTNLATKTPVVTILPTKAPVAAFDHSSNSPASSAPVTTPASVTTSPTSAPASDPTESPISAPEEPSTLNVVPVVLGDLDDQILIIDVHYDNHPLDTAWELTHVDEGDLIITSSGQSKADTTLRTDVTGLAPGWYSFDVFDTASDGLCCENGYGYFTLTDGITGNVLFSSNDSFQDDRFTVEVSLGLGFSNAIVRNRGTGGQ